MVEKGQRLPLKTISKILVESTAEPAYNRLQGNNDFCLLEEKSVITGVEYKRNKD